MKIWLDTTPTHKRTNRYGDSYSECDEGDCRDDCFIAAPPLPPSITEENMQYGYTQKLQRSPSLYFQPCQNDCWLICDPVGVGQVMIVDAEALAVLGEFHYETTVYEVIQRNRLHSASEIERLVRLFYKAGFLQNRENCMETPKRAVPE